MPSRQSETERRYGDAFVEADEVGVLTGSVHLVDWPTRTTACGKLIGDHWISRPPGLFYGTRRKNEGNRPLCDRCKTSTHAR